MNLTETFQRFLRSEQFGGALLIICTALSLVLANSPLGPSYLALWQAPLGPLSVEHWINDALMALFFLSWAAQLIAQWQRFTDESLAHGQDPRIGDFVSEFAASTFENWQSEFLQLFTFVTLAALYIHKGSAESKDGDEKLEASLRRIEEQLGTLPASAPTEPGEAWKLPDTPLEVADAQIRTAQLRETARGGT